MTVNLGAAVIEAAGGVVERVTTAGEVIAIIHWVRYGSEWALPKGKRQPNESWQQTALREVEEETGLHAAITAVAGATADDAGGTPKLVMYWRMSVPREVPPFVANDEVTQLAWLAPADAIERLTHADEARLLRSLFARALT